MQKIKLNKKQKYFLMVVGGMLLLLAVVFWMDYQEKHQRDEWAYDMEKEARPLNVQSRETKMELDDLQDNQLQEEKGKATLQLLFLEPSKQLYTEIVPEMQEYDLTGMILLPTDSAPKQEGAMSRKQLASLLEQDFALCLVYDGSQTIEEWLGAQEKLMKKWGVSGVTDVYFTSGSYQAKWDDTLAEAGFTGLIHHGEESQAIVSDVTWENEEEALWKLGACGWNSDNCRGYLNAAISQGGNLVFTIGGTQGGEQYDSEQFHSMMRTLARYVEQEDLVVTDVTWARTYQDSILQQGGWDTTYLDQIEDMEGQLEWMQRELDKIYRDYSDKVTGKE